MTQHDITPGVRCSYTCSEFIGQISITYIAVCVWEGGGGGGGGGFYFFGVVVFV